MQLTVEGLTYAYEEHLVFEKLNMQVSKGEFLSILGPSGCGKSTLLNILSGILPTEAGSICIDDEKIAGITPYFAYMPQDDLLLPHKTILENVCLYGEIHGEKLKSREKAMANMDKFGLAGYEDKYPSQLSGGMRQRAAFLRTALCPADILLLDEPFGALDVITRGNMQDWLLALRKELKRTTILVTHDIDEALYLSDRILILSGTPAIFQREFIFKNGRRSRHELYKETELRMEIYDCLHEL